jgi:hypothetical protein
MMGSGMFLPLFPWSAISRDEHCSHLAAVKDRYPLMAVQSAKHLGHAAAKIKNSGLHGFSSEHSECALEL